MKMTEELQIFSLLADTRFQTANEVLIALQQKKVDVALLDAFVTAAQKSSLIDLELKVKKVVSANTGFGFVLSKEMVRLENDFRSHITSKQHRIAAFISSMTNMIEARGFSSIRILINLSLHHIFI